ncbi:MAG: LptF/LptG family permease [Planctomycetota bacterium]
MRRIDRYLLFQFATTLVICFVSLAGLYTVIDAFTRAEDFTEGRSMGDAAKAAGRYYAVQSLGFFNRTSGVLALIAAMFTVTWAQRNNEMTALLAAGVPRLRVLRPVMIAAIAVAAAAAGVREFALPPMRHELSLDSKDLSGGRTVEVKPLHDNVTDLLVGGERANLATRTLVRPAFELPPRLAYGYAPRVVGATAAYLEDDGPRPAGYLVSGVSQPADLALRGGVNDRDGKLLIATRREASWLEPDQAFVRTGVRFDLLASGGQWRDLAATSELIGELHNPSTELGPDVRVAIHGRLLQPLLDVTLLLIGLPLVVSRGSGSPFAAIGLAVLVVTGFFLMTLGGQGVGAGGWLRPSLAAWLPLLVFAPVAAWQFPSLRQ